MKRAHVRFVVCALISILMVVLHYQNIMVPADVIRPSTFSSYSSWYSILNLSDNAFHPWRLDFLSGLLASFSSVNIVLVLHLLVFAAGVFCFARSLLPKSSILDSLATAVVSATLIITLFGFNQVVISSIAFFPFLVFVSLMFLNSAEDKKNRFLLLLCLVGVLHSQMANQLGVLLSFSAVGIACLLVDVRSSALIIKLLLAASVAPIVFAFFIPSPTFPSYPLLARVVPDDGIPGMLRPLVGADSPIPIIDSEYLREIYDSAVSIFIVLLSVSWLMLRNTKDLVGKKLFSLSSLFAFLIWLDVSTIQKVSIAMPLAAIQRVFPGIFFLNILPLCFILAGLFLLLAMQVRSGFLLQILLLVVLGSYPYVQGLTNFGSLQRADRFGALSAYKAHERNTSELSAYEDFLISPSYPIFNRFGFDFLFSKRKELLPAFKALPFFDGATVSTKEKYLDGIEKVADGRLDTRWSTRRAAQYGDEWIHLNLGSQYQVLAMMLDVGEFYTDFPRGIEIEYSSSCLSHPTDERDFKAYRDIYANNPWQGPISFTSDGYPYYKGQRLVKLVFKQPIVAKCLLLKQVSTAEHHDWSVAEILISAEVK